MVQVLDANGDKVTAATVNFIVYRFNSGTEVWEEYSSGTMQHIGNGIYTGYFTPDDEGEFTFYAYSENPKFHDTYTYYVETPVYMGPFNPTSHSINITPVTQNEWVEILNLQEGFIGYCWYFYQQNDEAATKNIAINLVVDNGGYNFNFDCPSQHQIFVYFSCFTGTFVCLDVTASEQPRRLMLGPGHWDNLTDGSLTQFTMPLECRGFYARIRMTDAPGTNNYIQSFLTYATRPYTNTVPT